MSLHHWLMTPIHYEDGFYLKDVLNIMSGHITRWYNNKNELSMLTDPNTFDQKWKEFLYQTYHKGILLENNYDENFQYFDLQYSDDISEIFEKYKEIEKFYNVDIFKNKSYDLLIEFLYQYIEIMEEIDEENSENEEDFLDYIIYER